MITPLDPVIAQIIPMLPLRDPETMTPQSARDALRALAAARAAVPPPPVASAGDTQVKGAAGPLAARVYRNSDAKSPTVVFFHGGGWVAGDLETHDRQARLLAIETGAVVVSVDTGARRKRAFPARSRTPSPPRATWSRASPNSAETRARRRGRRQRRRQSGGRPPRSPAAMPASSSPRNCWSIPSPMWSGISRTQRENARFPSRAENAEGYFLSRAVMEWFSGHYLERRKPMAPTGAFRRCAPKTLPGSRRRWSCTAWFDPLRDEGKAYAEALQAAGVTTSYHHGPGLIHGYFGLGEASETAGAKRNAPAPISRRCWKRARERGLPERTFAGVAGRPRIAARRD